MKFQVLNKMAVLLLLTVSYCGVAAAGPICPPVSELQQAKYVGSIPGLPESVFELDDAIYNGMVIVTPYSTQEAAEAALQMVTRSYPAKKAAIVAPYDYCMYAPFDNADLPASSSSSYHYTFVAFLPYDSENKFLLGMLKLANH